MKPTGILVPPRLARRPRDPRGFPVPAFAALDSDGVADFRVLDVEKWRRALKAKSCSLCGERLGRHLAFVGGPVSFETRLFTDLPMHRDCAEYALQVCPFMVAKSYRHAESVEMHGGPVTSVNPHVAPNQPEKFFLGISLGMSLRQLPSGDLVVHAEPWQAVEWWKHGARLLQPELLHEQKVSEA